MLGHQARLEVFDGRVLVRLLPLGHVGPGVMRRGRRSAELRRRAQGGRHRGRLARRGLAEIEREIEREAEIEEGAAESAAEEERAAEAAGAQAGGVRPGGRCGREGSGSPSR